MTERPSAAVIVPFFGSEAGLILLRQRLSVLSRRPGDEVIVSDNREHSTHTPGFARNRGADGSTAEWLVFVDADTIPEPDLLDAYFEPLPDESTAILAGAIRDVAAPHAGVVARHAVVREHMSHVTTLSRDGMPYAQTANCAVRRSAFEAAGGFDESARAGEDADLCFRLQRAGWRLETRGAAAVAHEGRDTLGAWLAQLIVHGSGAAWLARRWPEQFPPARPWSLLARLAHHFAEALRALVHADRDAAAFAWLDLVGTCAFELGRLARNHRRVKTRT